MTTTTAAQLRLQVLRGFELRAGGTPVPLAPGTQRLMAFLALQDRPVARALVAGVLWPEVPGGRAHANLRSALWRLQRSCDGLLLVSNDRLRLAPGTCVDVREVTKAGQRVLDYSRPLRETDLQEAVIEDLSAELLPDWYDDWVLIEREQYRQLRLHALEALSERLTILERYGAAIHAGLAAIRAEPLRETAHRAVIRAHLAEGNQSEALQHYRHCRRLLVDELGVEPSPQLQRLLWGSDVGDGLVSAGRR